MLTNEEPAVPEEPDAGEADPVAPESAPEPFDAAVQLFVSALHWLTRVVDRHWTRILGATALICSLFVLIQMRPDLLLSSSTPSGGDMGAHVWGPAFMRDHLLPSGRLTGWTPDWYAGFPAYHYYMVVPALAILAVNSGLHPILGLPLAAGVLYAAYRYTQRQPGRKILIWSLTGLAVVLLVGVSYGSAFKIVSVSGLVGMPAAAYLAGRLSRSPEPVPAFLAFGTLLYLFDTNFTIYGGNIASTLAGEFAFAISLCLAFVAIAVAFVGMDTGKYRASGSVVVALVALCHIIPLFFVIAALVVLAVLDERLPRWWILATGITMALVPVGLAEGSTTFMAVASVLTLVIVLGAIAISDVAVRARMSWLVVVGATSALLSSFWLAPFALRSDYFNDMGWERLDEVGPALLTTPMKVLLPIAVLGAFLAFMTRDRFGMLFSVLALTAASGVANLPDGKLWNARLLPFYYLSVYVLAAVAIALVLRFCASTVSQELARPDHRTLVYSTLLSCVVAIGVVSVPLQIFPFAATQEDGSYGLLGVGTTKKSFIPSWVAWNYSGYEEKRSFREYRDIVEMMDQLGEDVGCGRAMWEYSKDLDRYGTPMALMLLPHWTDGCIGSMEGLYFESSASTPFHFLNQSSLSSGPSRAQRDLPYKAFDIDRGIAQLQITGVRYYLAQTDDAILAARAHEELTELAVAEPFVIFEVAGSELVQGLDTVPVVAAGLDAEAAGPESSRFDQGWVSQAVAYYNDPTRYAAMPAEDGPTTWQRVSTLNPSDGTPVEPTAVSDIVVGTNSIEFSVEEVGKPVLVKMSYFPNWDVSGADGPWQIGPNLMVVVPTEQSVRMTYGYTGAEYLGYVLTMLGIASLVLASRYKGDKVGVVDVESQDSDLESQDSDLESQDSDLESQDSDLESQDS